MSGDLKLEGVHPLLVIKIRSVIAAMCALGFRMVVTDGLRTREQQIALYAKGRTKFGPIVTNADGIRKTSNHQGGNAVDCCFLDDYDRLSWDARLPWKAYGACCEAVGLVWGGSWTSFHDLPHAELPPHAT